MFPHSEFRQVAQFLVLKSPSAKRMMLSVRKRAAASCRVTLNAGDCPDSRDRMPRQWDRPHGNDLVPGGADIPVCPVCPESPKMELRKPADQLAHPALRLIAARPDIFIRQGYIAATYRRRNGKTYGPYYLLAYRDSGRQCSVYLGRAGELVQKVRAALAALQGPRIELRQFEHMERQIRAVLRVEKRHLASLLRPFGLRMKGFEIRGWRFSSLLRRPAAFRFRLSALRRLRMSYHASRSRVPSGTSAFARTDRANEQRATT
jgi:hypothetical protein